MRNKTDNTREIKVCYGISSRVDRYHHVFMIDYDDISLEDVLRHVIRIQKEYDLSDMYIIKSTHGFNAMCLDMLPLSLIYSIGIDIQSPADRNFFKYGFEREYFVLRFDMDKILLGVVANDSRKYTKSLAHKKFLEFYFDILVRDSNFNDLDRLDIVQYPSDKNGYHLVTKEIPRYLMGGIYDKQQFQG